MDRPVADSLINELAEQYGTPLYIYNANIIGERIADLRRFDVIRYAEKANANLSLLNWIRDQGVTIDTVSVWEIERALKAGYTASEIVFTADLFDHHISKFLREYHVHVNLGSPDMLEQYTQLKTGREVTLRINPGFGHGHDRKVNTGGEESKHGIWHESLPAVLKRAGKLGLKVTGIHMHIGSGSDFTHLSRVREAISKAAFMAKEHLTTISVGGGLPVPYRPDEKPFDVAHYCADWLATKKTIEAELGKSINMEVEPGRYLVAECGLLVCEVRGIKSSGAVNYILVDAGFDNLIRPAMYGAYHHITIPGRASAGIKPQVVAGPLCESADVFTQTKGGYIEPRPLPETQAGDLLCIHNAGAYTASMASNYNSRPLAAEVLVENGAARLVRQRQSLEDMLSNEIDYLQANSR